MHAARALFDFESCVAAGRRVHRAHFGEGPAALAAAGHALDRDDLHWRSLTHPGAIVWAVVLGAGAEADLSGADAIRAAAVGYEVTTRLASALGVAHRRYWHATATAGTVGAAAAAALALGLDEGTVAQAVGHAVSVAGGSIQCVVERSGTRLFHRAHAAASGLAAARAARAGLDATRFGLESEQGLFAATAGGNRPEAALAIPSRWAIEELWIRIHAASGFAHTALEAAVELGPLRRERVRRIEVGAPRASLALAGVAKPTDRDEGWWSVPYSVAVCLLAGSQEPLGSDALLDVSDLLAVTALTDNEADLGATVTVELDDGTVRSATCEVPLGHPERPLDDGQLIAKWRALRIGPDREADSLLDLAHRFGELPVREYVARRPPSLGGAA